MKEITLDILLHNRNLLLDRPITSNLNQAISQNDDLFLETKTDFDPFQMKGMRALLEYDFE